MKECKKCGETKSTSEFSKCSVRKDGLQYNCKSCNKKDNHKFRTEINPSHHANWQRNNLKRLCELIKNYRRADKNGLIYSIRNPEGDTYIGMTQMYLKVRRLEHISHYRKYTKGQRDTTLPLLHASFDKYGIENHQFETILDMGNIDRKQLSFIETSFIQAFQQIGKSLNIRIK
jgi:predicted GIY-YIG superfamily endonuclease